MSKLYMDNNHLECYKEFTVSIKDDATTALVTPPALMFARTGAPKPIEESWRLK